MAVKNDLSDSGMGFCRDEKDDSFKMKGTGMKKVCSLVIIIIVISCYSSKAQWVQLNQGLTNTNILVLAVSDTNLFAGTLSGGIFRSTNNGTSWTSESTGLPSNASVYTLTISGAILFAGIDGSGIFRSTNNGTNWTVTGLSNPEVLALAASGTDLFAGTYFDGVFRSTNNGTSWTAVGLTNIIVQALAVSGTNLFAGTRGGGVFRSTDNGTNWVEVNTGLTNLNVNALAVIGTNLFAGTNYSGVGGVYRSTNNGTDWIVVNTGLPLFPTVTSFAASGLNLFAGTNPGGVFLCTNNDTNWAAVNTGLMNTFVYALAVSSTHLFAGSFGGGVWGRSLSEMITDVGAIEHTPTEFLLSQNYPNPYNPITKIKYSIPQSLNVIIRVFDILGNEIETLVNEEKPVGTYEVNFNASQLSSGISTKGGYASGVYFYTINAGSFIETKKMILMK